MSRFACNDPGEVTLNSAGILLTVETRLSNGEVYPDVLSCIYERTKIKISVNVNVKAIYKKKNSGCDIAKRNQRVLSEVYPHGISESNKIKTSYVAFCAQRSGRGASG